MPEKIAVITCVPDNHFSNTNPLIGFFHGCSCDGALNVESTIGNSVPFNRFPIFKE